MITFREIDKSNYMDCICLQVADGQKGFVADNARSLVEARFEEGLYTRGIYADGVMVGFLLFDYDPEIPGWSLSRMMIGAQYQGRGYGTAAVKAFLQYIRDTMAIRELCLCVELENTVAAALYHKLGFRDVGTVEYDFDGVHYVETQMKIAL